MPRFPSPITNARLKTTATLFVCADCPSGKQQRREFKRAVKAAGRKRELRVVSCGCLDLCPKRGTAIVLARGDRPARVAIAADAADAEAILEVSLLDERVGDAVADQHR